VAVEGAAEEGAVEVEEGAVEVAAGA